MGVKTQADLLEVVGALDSAGRLADLLYRRQEQANQNCDDRNDHEKLD
jgi:hypothetical protein